ncbi:hypothetical protein BGZ98_005243 [Dissophora globulifera]|nr:hypothetical protein BGZ98_005243 [Dissophora globulifera]
MAQMLDIINAASVTIMLPDIQREVGYKVDQLQWVTSAYALAYGAFLLIGDRLGDLFGHRRIFLMGAAWFSIWTLVNGFAKNDILMSIGRALQGMGWRWVFYITSVIGFSVMFIGLLIIPAEKDESVSTNRRIDYIGLASFTLGLVGVIYYLSEGPAAGWASAQTLAPLFVGLTLLGVFLVVESRIDYPIMPFHVWRSRRLISSCIIVIMSRATLRFHTSLNYIVHGVGIVVTIMALTKLVTLVRTKIVVIVGWLFFIASGILFAQIKADSSYWSIAFPAFILNVLGLGPPWLCCQINSVADADDEDQGVVGAVYNVSMQVGAPIGIAISNIVANSRNPPGTMGVDLLLGYHAAFYTYAIMGGVGLILTVLIAPNQDVIPEEKISSGVAGGAGREELGMEVISHAEGKETARNSQILEPTRD